jgi:hypothetical protein
VLVAVGVAVLVAVGVAVPVGWAGAFMQTPTIRIKQSATFRTAQISLPRRVVGSWEKRSN